MLFVFRGVCACNSTCPDRTACLVNGHLWRHMHEHFGVLSSGYMCSWYYSSRQWERQGRIWADWKGFAGVNTSQGSSKRSRGWADDGDNTSRLGAQGQGNFWLTAARNSPAVKGRSVRFKRFCSSWMFLHCKTFYSKSTDTSVHLTGSM